MKKTMADKQVELDKQEYHKSVDIELRPPTEDHYGNKIPVILWHHGTCDMCGARYIVVCHFGYDTQPTRDYRICKNCMADNVRYIIYGAQAYKSGMID